MSNRSIIEKVANETAQPLSKEMELEIWDVEYVKELGEFYLRIYIDKPGGVDVQDCQRFSRAFEAIFDEIDPIKEAYILEVSSPGLDRPLKKDNDFARSIGKLVEFKLYKALDGQKEFMGTLKAFDEESMTIEIDGKEQIFIRKEVAHIRLAVIF